MGIEPQFDQGLIRKRMTEFLEVIEEKQIERLQMLGDMCVTHARLIPPEIGFTDQTGNLRSSIGYMIFKDGVVIHTSYKQVQGGNEGVNAGQTLAKKVAQKYTNGIVLVVTAGMNYAIHVESKGRDVLTSAESLARQELPKMVEKLVSNINKAIE